MNHPTPPHTSTAPSARDNGIYYCACGFGPATIENVVIDAHPCFDPPRPITTVNPVVVEMTGDIYARFAGLTASGCLVVDDYGITTALTQCCHAFASYHDDQLCCKACHAEVPLEHSGPAEIATPRHLITAHIPSATQPIAPAPLELITRSQAETWAGRPLSDEELDQLDTAIPNSSIPQAIETIIASLDNNN